MSTINKEPDRILTRAELKRIVPVSDMTLWRWERDGKFPKRIVLARNKVGWRFSSVMLWLDGVSTEIRTVNIPANDVE